MLLCGHECKMHKFRRISHIGSSLPLLIIICTSEPAQDTQKAETSCVTKRAFGMLLQYFEVEKSIFHVEQTWRWKKKLPTNVPPIHLAVVGKTGRRFTIKADYIPNRYGPLAIPCRCRTCSNETELLQKLKGSKRFKCTYPASHHVFSSTKPAEKHENLINSKHWQQCHLTEHKMLVLQPFVVLPVLWRH